MTPHLNLPETDLANLCCSRCKNYLSFPPITSNADDRTSYNCGRCLPKADHEHPRLAIYETLAKYAQFPCRYFKLGCQQESTMAETPNHELACQFRVMRCPIDKCKKTESVRDIESHVSEVHDNYVIYPLMYWYYIPEPEPEPENTDDDSEEDGQSHDKKKVVLIRPSVQRDEKKKMIIVGYDFLHTREQCFFLQVRTCWDEQKSGRRLDLALGCFLKIPDLDAWTYHVVVESRKTLGSLVSDRRKIIMYQPGWPYPQQDMVSFYISTLEEALCCDDLHFKIVVYENDKIRYPVTTAPTADSDSIIKKIKFMEELECIVCKEYMRSAIYLCKTGHSLCAACHRRISSCPTCMAGYDGSRNYLMEKVIERVEFPCMFKSRGCDQVDVPSKIAYHERRCSFREPFSCPLRKVLTCLWKGTLTKIALHVACVHRQSSWLSFNQTLYLDCNLVKLHVLVTEFDSKPFYVSIAQMDSLLTFWVEEGDAAFASEKNSYEFSLHLYQCSSFRDTWRSPPGFSRDLTNINDSGWYRKITKETFQPFINVDNRLFFRIKAVTVGVRL